MFFSQRQTKAQRDSTGQFRRRDLSVAPTVRKADITPLLSLQLYKHLYKQSFKIALFNTT